MEHLLALGAGQGQAGGVETEQVDAQLLAQRPRHRELAGAGRPDEVEQRPALAAGVRLQPPPQAHHQVAVRGRQRHGADRAEHLADPLVRPVDAEQVVGDALVEAQRAGARRRAGSAGLRRHQAEAAQRCAGQERVARRHPLLAATGQERERQVRRRVAAARVVLHVGVEPLETGVELGSEGEEEDGALEIAQAQEIGEQVERRRRPPRGQGAAALGGGALGRREGGAERRRRGVLAVEDRRRRRVLAGEQPVGLGVADHQPLVGLQRVVLPLPPQPQNAAVQAQAQGPQLGVQIGPVGLRPGEGHLRRRRAHGIHVNVFPSSRLCAPLTSTRTG